MSLHKYTKKFSFQESKGSFTLDAGIGIHRWIASTQRAADLALHRRHQLSDRKYYIIQQHATIHCVKSVQSERALAKANVKFYKFVAFWIVNFTFPNWLTFIFLPKKFFAAFRHDLANATASFSQSIAALSSVEEAHSLSRALAHLSRDQHNKTILLPSTYLVV